MLWNLKLPYIYYYDLWRIGHAKCQHICQDYRLEFTTYNDFSSKNKKMEVIKKHTSEINTIYMTLLAHNLIRQTSKLFLI